MATTDEPTLSRLNPADWLRRNRAAWTQMLRVMIGCGVTYGLVRLWGLQQGYWALFTVLIVMQGSVGATLGAATDRMLATVGGAVLGGIAVFVTPHEPLAIGIALVVAAGLTTLAASLNPRLRSMGVTAAIVILTRNPDVPVGTFVVDRILEIGLGGVIGVIASRFVLPARSGTALVDGLAAVLDAAGELLRHQADALERGESFSSAEAGISLRTKLTATEALMADANREQSAMLGKHGVSPAVPRTLWRVRNDIAYVGRLIETPFHPAMREAVGAPAAALLRAEADFAVQCGTALKAGTPVGRDEDGAVVAAFEAAFADLRQSKVTLDLDMDDVGRPFGLSFALQRLRQDFLDLAERIDERLKPDPMGLL